MSSSRPRRGGKRRRACVALVAGLVAAPGLALGAEDENPRRQLADAASGAFQEMVAASAQDPARPDQARSRTVAAPSPTAPRLNPTGRTISLVVPITDGSVALGETTITLGADDTLRVGVDPTLKALSTLLDPRALERLTGQIAGRRELSAEEWAGLGYPVSYDPGRIEVRVTVPATDRVARGIDLAELERGEVGSFEAPAGLAGYLNVRGSIDFVHTGDEDGLGDPNLLFDTAWRVRNFVFETEANWSSAGADGEMRFQREGSRVVWDDIGRTLRWSAGDVTGLSGGGFTSVGNVLGVTVFRNYSDLAPQRFVRPRGERQFVLERPATVEAFVNDRSVRRLRLDPGTYTLRDFPFTDGANDVRIVIEDDTGVREALNFNLFFDRTLLERGLTEFSLTAGQRTELGDNGPEYGGGDWVIGGFYRRGVSDSLTAAVSFQAEESGQLIGAESTWGARIGTIGLDGAISNTEALGTGFAVNLSLSRLMASRGGRNNSLNATFEYRSEEFAIPGGNAQPNPIEFQIGAGYSFSLGEFSFGGIDVRHSASRGDDPDRSTVRATFGRRIGDRFNLTADASWQDDGIEQQVDFRIALTYRLGENSSLRGEYETRSERARLSWQSQRGQGVGSRSLSADIDYGRDDAGANLSASYVANRAELGYAFTTAYDRTSSEITSQRSSLRAGTAIAFADGSWAIGRPISDSFAILKPHASLGAARLLAEPSERGHIANSGGLGAALFSDLSAYSDRSITVDVPDAPAGYDIGAGSFRVRPGYRSGYVFEVGSDYSITLIGRLIDRDGAPIALLAGSAVEAAEPDREPVTVFTNRDGRFALAGARPGVWRVTMPTVPPSIYEITVQAGADAIVRLGDLEPK
jgi:outer membrane usher protein